MKTYYIFIGMVVFGFILLLGVPQLMGNIYVNNLKDKKPADWLSSLLIKDYKEQKGAVYAFPDHIKTIVINGNHSDKGDRNVININESTSNLISFPNNSILTFETKGDSIIINLNKDVYVASLDLNLDTSQWNIVCENFNGNSLIINQNSPLNISIRNQSLVNLVGNRNRNLNNISVSDRSTLNLQSCFTPIIDLQIDNSMVYVSDRNHIDSLKANLIGKSNIKKISSTYHVGENFGDLKKEFGIEKNHVNIIPTGNMKYVSNL